MIICMVKEGSQENVLILLEITDNHVIKNILENINELSIIISVFVWRIMHRKRFCQNNTYLGIQIDSKQKRQ